VKGSRHIGSISRIPVYVHWSFFLVILWSGHIGYRAGGWGSVLFSITLTTILFGCVFLHELGHALAARRYGVVTRSITLLPIGGVAALERIPERPREELVIALAGPMVNVVIAGVLIGFIGWPHDMLTYGAQWNFAHLTEMVLLMNLIMIFFNLIPAFPMDGGRVLRACLAIFLSYPKATAIASVIGQIMALGMIVFGLQSNPFLCLIGVMVFLGAKAESRLVHMRSNFTGIYVRDIMSPTGVLVTPHEPARVCLDGWYDRGQTDYLVTMDGRVVGLVGESEWRKHLVDPDPAIRIGHIMERPVIFIRPEMPVFDLMDLIRSTRQSLFPVMEYDQPVGVVTRRHVYFILQQDPYAMRRVNQAEQPSVHHKPDRESGLRLDVG